MGKAIFYNTPCEMYRGFLSSDKSFSKVLKDIIDFVLYDLKKDLKDYAIDEEKLKIIADDKLGVNYSTPAITWRAGKRLYKQYIEENKNSPAFFSISKGTYWYLRDEDTTEWDRAVILAYLAVKSMLGNRDMIKTNMTLIFSRMDGNTKSVSSDRISKPVAKYLNRYWSKKILTALYKRYGVVSYGGNQSHKVRGFYISTKLTMEQLITKAEADMKVARSKPKDPLQDARRKAMENIRSGKVNPEEQYKIPQPQTVIEAHEQELLF